MLLDDLSLDELRGLLKEETIKRYHNEDVDLTPLLAKRRNVAGITNSHLQSGRRWPRTGL